MRRRVYTRTCIPGILLFPTMETDMDEVVAALEEMVSIYQDEIAGGVPMDYEDQPSCIRRAMDALSNYKKNDSAH